jgi:hypothetical protein
MSGYTSKKSFDEVFNKVQKEMPEEKFVVYPDPQFSIEELIQHKNMTENEDKTDVTSVIPENILELPTEPEVLTEVPTLVDQNQGEEEPKELTEEEKREKFIEALKASHQRYHPKKHFGVVYHKERKRKNKMQKASRKLNRKK